MSTIASVSPLYVFGANIHSRDPFQFVDNHTFLYIAGGNLVLYNPSTKQQKFVPSTSRESTATAVCVTKERNLLAVGEVVPAKNSDSSENPQPSSTKEWRSQPSNNFLRTKACVNFYGLPAYRKRKNICVDDAFQENDKQQLSSINGLSFSSDSKLIAVLASNVFLSYWHWEKSKCVGWVIMDIEPMNKNKPIPSLSVSVNPFDDGMIAVHGPCFLRMFTSENGNLTQITIKFPVAEFEINSFIWISASQYAIGARGCVIIMESHEFKCFYSLEPVGLGFKVPGQSENDSGINHQHHQEMEAGFSPNAVLQLSRLPKKVHAANNNKIVHAMTISTRLLVVASSATLFIYEREQGNSTEVLKLLFRSPITASSDSTMINSTLSTNNNLGVLNDPDIVVIRSLVINGSEDVALVILEDGTSYLVNISMIELAKGDALQCTLVLPAFHSGPITSMDVCFRKPLIATGSIDRSIRIWNFSQFSCELVKNFPDEPLSITIHPSGYYLLAGFSDKLRLFTILPDDLRLLHEFPIRGCKECAFARGGHRFAAVHGSLISIYNVWTFELIATLKAHNRRIKSLYWTRGSGTTLSKSMDLDDTRLISCGADGAVYAWMFNRTGYKQVETSQSSNDMSLQASNSPVNNSTESNKRQSVTGISSQNKLNLIDVKRSNEYISKGICFNAAVDVAGTMYAVGSDRTLKVVSESLLIRDIKSSQVDLVQLATSQAGTMFFVGTGLGSIKAIKSPMPPEMLDFDSSEFMQEHSAHSGLITKLRITGDDKFLVSASEDGCMMVFRIFDKESASKGDKMDENQEGVRTVSVSNKQASSEPDATESKNGPGIFSKSQVESSEYANEIVTTKADFEEKLTTITELQLRLDELKNEQDYQLRLKDLYVHDQLKILTTNLSTQVSTLKTQYALLRSEKDKDSAKNSQKSTSIGIEHAKELKLVETRNTQQLMVEYEKFRQVQAQLLEKQAGWEKDTAQNEQARIAQIAHLKTQFQAQVQHKTELLNAQQDLIIRQEHEFKEHLRQQAEDIETEVMNYEHKYETQLKSEKQVSFQIKGENAIMKNKFLTLIKEIEDKELELVKLRDTETRLLKIMTGLEREVEILKSETMKRDSKISDQERRLFDLKKSSMELEKHKFVLDHTLKALKVQIEPRELAISKMVDQIKSLNMSLSDINHHKQAMTELQKQLDQALKCAHVESTNKHNRNKAYVRMLEQFQADISFTVTHIQDPSVLARSVDNLVKKHCSKLKPMEMKAVSETHHTNNTEIQTQELSLKKTISRLESQLGAQANKHRANQYKQVHENSNLIKEVRALRALRLTSEGQPTDLPVSLRGKPKANNPPSLKTGPC